MAPTSVPVGTGVAIGNSVRYRGKGRQTGLEDSPTSSVRGCMMHAKCVVCEGSGIEDQVDTTLPPPPCRVCHPVEAARHQMLARATLRIDTAHRFAAFLALRDARDVRLIEPRYAAQLSR